MSQTLVALKGVETERHRVSIDHLVEAGGSKRIQTDVFFHQLDWHALGRRIGDRAVRRLAAALALFESYKLISVFPDVLDISAVAPDLGPSLLRMFKQALLPALSQHLYQRGRTDYLGPRVTSSASLGPAGPIVEAADHGPLLVLNGGGKDSLLVMNTLRRAGVEFGAMQWARPEYGRWAKQHALIQRLYAAAPPAYPVHEVTVVDNYSESPYATLECGGSGVFSLGTPECLFMAAPVALAEGFSGVVLGNERSASEPNLRRNDRAPEVNHQWVKSLPAEEMFADAIEQDIGARLGGYSLLRPLYDRRIFAKLEPLRDHIWLTHSCNVDKPWCGRCPKCAYVWLGLTAWVGDQEAARVRSQDLLNDPVLAVTFDQLMERQGHKPFECVGTVDEVRLALRRCCDRGKRGMVIDAFRERFGAVSADSWDQLEHKYLARYDQEHRIPAPIWERVACLL
jgi:UDP-N-acetyl-alpha-D-muramoyl-L-alanyl-L-glutamate epimerase